MDGRLRVIERRGGKYTWHAKDRDIAQPVPAALQREFESLPWPEGITLCVEWMGMRQKNGKQEIYIFDILEFDGKWIGNLGFLERRKILYDYINPLERVQDQMWNAMQRSPSVYLLEMLHGSFVDRFQELLTEPEDCEGLVVRAADQKHVGNPSHCQEAKVGFWKIRFQDIKEK